MTENTPTATRNLLVRQAITGIANMDATKQTNGKHLLAIARGDNGRMYGL